MSGAVKADKPDAASVRLNSTDLAELCCDSLRQAPIGKFAAVDRTVCNDAPAAIFDQPRRAFLQVCDADNRFTPRFDAKIARLGCITACKCSRGRR